jgi:hypothetical protein
MFLMAGIIGIVFYTVDDHDAKRMTLIQGGITIICAIIYRIYLINYEHSKKQVYG